MTDEAKMETYLTAEELAKRWKMSVKTLADRRRVKRGPSYFQPDGKNGSVRYNILVIEDYEKQNTFSHTGAAQT